MIRGIHHVGLTVADARATIAFFLSAADLVAMANVESQLELPTSAAARPLPDVSMLRSANAYLRFLEPLKDSAPRQVMRSVAEAGIVHICLQSTSIDYLYGRFKEAGATFHAPPVDLGTGFLYSYARDHEANVVELEGVPPVWEDPAPWIAHVSFTSANIDRLVAFYSGVFGETAIRSPRVGPNNRFDEISGMKGTEFKAAWIQAGNMQVEVIQYFQPATLAHTSPRSLGDVGYSYVCFEVTNLQQARAHMMSLGATQTPELAALGTANCCVCADPDGNILVLIELDASTRAFSIAALPDPMIVSRMAAMREQLKGMQEQNPKKASIQ